jgi:7-cyano-7-deazaguanine synthase in queuosine biosynthesis
MTRFQVRVTPDEPVDPAADALLDWFPGDRARSTVQYEPAFLRGLAPSAVAHDLFRVGGAVFCADKSAPRDDTQDFWTRDIELQVPVSNVPLWQGASDRLHEALTFLSGDHWTVTFVPLPEIGSGVVQEGVFFEDAVCLFSGGLDSLAGVIDLLEGGRRLVLVGHHDSPLPDNRQVALFRELQSEYGPDRVTHRRLLLGRAAARPQQLRPLDGSEPEITQRSRSFLFISAGVAVADAIGAHVPLYVPENGFIGINVPLTDARAGSLSTRTTHPYFIERMEALLGEVGLPHAICNPYRLLTKGEALQGSANLPTLTRLAPESISCSHPEWARLRHMPQGNCGTCYPCLIRRASLHAVGEDRASDYTWDALTNPDFLRREWESGASLRALLTRLGQPARVVDVLRNGRIPGGETRKFFDMYCRGRQELLRWLRDGGAAHIQRRLP